MESKYNYFKRDISWLSFNYRVLLEALDERLPLYERINFISMFSCRFKCPCPPRRQRHFHGNADRAYNTLHFASQSCVPNGGVAPFGNPHKKRRYATPPRGAYRLFLLSSPPAVSVEQKSAWEWCGIFI